MSPTPPETDAAPRLSILIPTHNPRPDYLRVTLEALRAQTLPMAEWELVIVDNASEPPVAGWLDVSWHPRARVLHEPRRGAHHAREHGLRECRGELIVYVDDDNALEPDYLAATLALAQQWPQLGVWGGRIEPEFETPPPAWLDTEMHHLAICRIEWPVWSSFAHDWTVPYGAGMCVRREVVERFFQRFEEEPMLGRFGRSDLSAVSGEDQLMSYAAISLGLGVGRFPNLRLRHLIPARRMETDYLLGLAQGNAHGALLIQLIHGSVTGRRQHLFWPVLKMAGTGLLWRGMRRRIAWAEARGEISALREMARTRRRDEPPAPAVTVPAAASR